MRYIVLFVMICLGFSSRAQDYKADMLKVKSTYENLKHFQCSYEISVYFNGKLQSAITMDAKVSDSCYMYTIGKEITTLCNSSTLLTVDEDLKFIAVGKRKKFTVDIDNIIDKSLDTANYTIDSAIMQNGDHTYVFNYKSGDIKQTTITLDPKTGLISYMDYTSSQEEEYEWRKYGLRKTVIKFRNLKPIEKLPDSYFSVAKYVIEEQGAYKASTAYKNYMVIDTDLKTE